MYTFPLSLSYVVSSICVPIYVPFAFRFGVSLLCSIFPFFLFIRYTVCTINPFRFTLSLFACFFFLRFFFFFTIFEIVLFKAHLILPFSRNSMQFLWRWSCISKKKRRLKIFQNVIKVTRIRSSNKLRRVRCCNGDMLEISLLVNLSFWLEIWSVFYVQWIQKWLKCVLIQKRRLL